MVEGSTRLLDGGGTMKKATPTTEALADMAEWIAKRRTGAEG